MNYTIYNKTVLIPYIIAENSAWEVLEDKYKDLTPQQCAMVVEKLSPLLCIRADFHFNKDKLFRKQISASAEKGRDTLAAFMYHWTLGLLGNNALINLVKQ